MLPFVCLIGYITGSLAVHFTLHAGQQLAAEVTAYCGCILRKQRAEIIKRVGFGILAALGVFAYVTPIGDDLLYLLQQLSVL